MNTGRGVVLRTAGVLCGALSIVCVGTATAQEANSASAEPASASAPPANEEPLLHQENLLDKKRIAEETFGKLQGLRALDNPHIAEGLLLRRLEVDPERSRVDADLLRDRRLSAFAGRRVGPATPAATRDRERQTPEARERREPRAVEPAAAPGGDVLSWIALASIAVVVGCALLARWMR